MTGSFHLRQWLAAHTDFGWRDDRAAQIVEFAVALPLLVVFVVGIFDFSGAFTLKQKLTNIARDAARTAAADPANDLSDPLTALPTSVNDVLVLVQNYMTANKIPNCGIASTGAPAGLTWTFAPPGGTPCPNGVQTLIVNRGYYFPQSGGALPAATCAVQGANGQTAIVATCVSIQYVYPWRFGRAASLFGTTATLPTTLTVTAVAMNEN